MFWTLIFNFLSTPFGENKVSRDVCKQLILGSIFEAFRVCQHVSRIDKKSILEVILGQEGSREISSSANMAPSTDFDRFSIDFSLIWGWIVQALATKLRIPDRRHRPQGLYNNSDKNITYLIPAGDTKVSQLLGVSGRCACKASLLHIHCTTSCTLPVKLWLKPHLKSQLT